MRIDTAHAEAALNELRPRHALRAVLALAAVLACLFLRKPDVFLHPQLWAEDGLLFLSQARELGASAFIVRYAGYLHFLPRLISFIGQAVSLTYVPLFYNTMAAAVSAGLVVVCLFSTRVNLPRKPLLALAIAFVPHNTEVFSNITNMQWICALVLVLLVVAEDPRGPADWLQDGSLSVCIGLTGPFIIFFSPLMALRWYVRRSRPSLILTGLWLGLAAVQALSLGTSRGQGSGWNPHLSVWISYFGQGISGLLLFGAQAKDCGPVLRVVLFFISIALVAWLLFSSKRNRLWPQFVFVLAGLSVLAASGIAFRAHPDTITNELGDRYFYLPMVLFMWALILQIQMPRPHCWLAIGALSLSAIATLTMWKDPEIHDPHWRENVTCLERERQCVVPIDPPGWSVTLLRVERR